MGLAEECSCVHKKGEERTFAFESSTTGLCLSADSSREGGPRRRGQLRSQKEKRRGHLLLNLASRGCVCQLIVQEKVGLAEEGSCVHKKKRAFAF